MSPVPARKPPERPVPEHWPVGEDPARLTLTANAGVLLEWQGHKLLIDALHDGGDHQFSAVPPPILDDMAAGRPPFDGIEWLLFTHLHVDHFSAGQVERFLQTFPQVPLFLPAGNGGEGVDPAINVLRQYLMAHASPVRELKLPEGRPVCYPLCPGLRVTAFYAQHDGEQFQDTQHYCLMFTLGGRNVLFLGDSLQDPDYFADVLQDTAVDTVVINPLFLNRPSGRETLSRAVRPGKIVVNHIPFAWEDRMRFREMVVRNVTRWHAALPSISVLWDPLDTITI